MTHNALGYNLYINPFSSHAVDVFHHFTYVISPTVISSNLDTLHVERYCWFAWQQHIIVSLTFYTIQSSDVIINVINMDHNYDVIDRRALRSGCALSSVWTDQRRQRISIRDTNHPARAPVKVSKMFFHGIILMVVAVLAASAVPSKPRSSMTRVLRAAECSESYILLRVCSHTIFSQFSL